MIELARDDGCVVWWELDDEAVEAVFADLLASEPIVPVDHSTPVMEVLRLVRLAHLRLERTVREIARDAGYDLGSTAIHVLRYLGPRGTPISSIADALLVTRQAAGQVVGRLDSLGLTERRTEWSTTLVAPTAEGRALVRTVATELGTTLDGWSPALTPDVLARLATDLAPLAEDPGARWGQV